jgi:hypothetical protein
MYNLRATIILTFLMALGSSGFLFTSCKGKSMEGMIIISRTTGKTQDIKSNTDESRRYTTQSQIVVINPEKTGSAVKVLTSGYFSAFSPEISCDAMYMLFSARQKETDNCQIYEMNLSNSKIRQVTFEKGDCTDPAYLPNGRIVYSKSTGNDILKRGNSLFTCNADGSDIRKITFNPDTYFSSTVLKDGRVLTLSSQIYPDKQDAMLIVLRPDGTKAELFYKGEKGSSLINGGRETGDGKIVFIESGNDGQKRSDVISINYNRPMHTRVNLTSELKGNFYSALPLQTGKLLVSYKLSDSDRYSLYEFDPEKKALGRSIYNNAENDVLEAVLVEKHERAKKLPSEVDMGVKTGLLLCQDINVFNLQSELNVKPFTKSSRIEVIGIDSIMGTINVEKDGSFYLKVMADTPFRIQTIDEKGKVLNGPCGWIWLRPNERRGCVGCHEDPELVPDNKVPFSVKKAPFSVPVHINKVVEKKISLE